VLTGTRHQKTPERRANHRCVFDDFPDSRHIGRVIGASKTGMKVWPGNPYPLSATFDGAGVNFSISEVAEPVKLGLFDILTSARLLSLPSRVGSSCYSRVKAPPRRSSPWFRSLSIYEEMTMPERNIKLGFAVKVLGGDGLKSHDSRRWRNKPHLRVSLQYLERIFYYLEKHDIGMYRMSSDLAPYATHPDMPQFHGMVQESKAELRQIGRRARELGLRLSFHPSQFVILNSNDPELTRKSIWDLTSQAEMLDLMELGPEAVMVIHVGGVYGDRAKGCQRWVQKWKTLPEPVRRRLVLENDDLRYSAADVLWIHGYTGVRLVFDFQHFWCFNPERLDLLPTIERMLRTWPANVRPKIHFSSTRTDLRELKRKNKKTKKNETVYVAPIATGHADFVNIFEFATFIRSCDRLTFDVMLESKAKDLALLRLRGDLLRYAPAVAARFGLAGLDARVPESELDLVEV
jgi:UV DNA damage endonuclease